MGPESRRAGRRWTRGVYINVGIVIAAAVGAFATTASAGVRPTRPGTVTAPAAVRGLAGLPSLPSLGPYVQFGRVTYTDSASAYDPKLQLIVVQAGASAKSYVAQLHSEAPGIKVLAYQSMWLRPSGDPAGYTTCLAGSGSYPSSYYMTGTSGTREAWNTTSGTQYQMNFSNPGYVAACAAHAIAIAKSIGADGVFMDGLATTLFYAQLPSSCTGTGASSACTTNAAWQSAMTGALGTLAGQLHSRGLLLAGNIGGGNDTTRGGGPAVWQRYDGQMDGAMEESWTYGTNHAPVSATQVNNGLANVVWSEAHGKYTLVNDDVTNCASCSGYGMATLMLVGQGRSSYDLSSGSYGNYSAWWASYGKAAGMGVSLGSYTTQANGLKVRRFVNGTIVVNDTASPITDLLFGTVPADSALIH